MAKKIYERRDLSGFARFATITLWAQIALWGIIGLLWLVPGVADTFVGVDGVPTGLGLVITLLQSLNFLALAIGGLAAGLWVIRASGNAHVIKPNMHHSAASAVWWYVVPFASLWMPYQALKEVWDVAAGPGSPARKDKTPLFWWLAYLGANVLSLVIAYGLSGSPIAQLVSAAASIASAYLYLRVVQRVTDMLDRSRVAEVFSDAPQDSVLQAASF